MLKPAKYIKAKCFIRAKGTEITKYGFICSSCKEFTHFREPTCPYCKANMVNSGYLGFENKQVIIDDIEE